MVGHMNPSSEVFDFRRHGFLIFFCGNRMSVRHLLNQSFPVLGLVERRRGAGGPGGR